MKTITKAAAAVCLAASLNSYAQNTLLNNMNFTVSVFQTCTIEAITNTNFGFIDGNFLTSTTATNGTISVLCTDGSPYSIGLGNGDNFANGTRNMSNGATPPNLIAYSVFQDANQTVPWGDIGVAPENGLGTGLSQTYVAYSSIPSGQAPVPVGNYFDQVLVTLSF